MILRQQLRNVDFYAAGSRVERSKFMKKRIVFILAMTLIMEVFMPVTGHAFDDSGYYSGKENGTATGGPLQRTAPMATTPVKVQQLSSQ